MEWNTEFRNKATHTCQLIYDKEANNIQGGNTVSSINGARKTGQPHAIE